MSYIIEIDRVGGVLGWERPNSRRLLFFVADSRIESTVTLLSTVKMGLDRKVKIGCWFLDCCSQRRAPFGELFFLLVCLPKITGSQLDNCAARPFLATFLESNLGVVVIACGLSERARGRVQPASSFPVDIQ